MTPAPVLCFGEALVDCLADQPGLPLAAVTSWTTYPGGAPANVAAALAKLGSTSRFVGCVGNDESGRALIATLAEAGVNCDYATLHRTLPTRLVYVLRDQQGDRHFAAFSQPDPTCFADAQFKPEWVAPESFDALQFLVMGTLGLAYPDTGRAMTQVLRYGEDKCAKVVIDVNWRPMFWPDPAVAPAIILKFLQQANFLKLSVDEAHWLFGTDDPKIIRQQLNQLEGVLITAGNAGCTYYLGAHYGAVPAFEVDVEDTTGAGDAFLAGFLHQLCEQGMGAFATPESAKATVTFASAVGALATLRPGAIAAQPTRREVEAFLYLHQGIR
ncbi:MAG: carbohydrate kinase [Cyanobacteria bacterium J06635_15]